MTTADEREILRMLAEQGPTSSRALFDAMEPYPRRAAAGNDVLWCTAVRRRGRRGLEGAEAEADLAERGLVGGSKECREITQAGREELARANAEGGGAS